MAGEPTTTIIGNLTADPTPRISNAGKQWATFTVAQTPRVKNRDTDKWEDGEPIYMNCRVFGDIADNVCGSLTKGSRVMVHGRFKRSTYTDNNGVQRESLDMEVDEIAASLRWAKVTITKSGSKSGGAGGFGGSQQSQGQSGWVQSNTQQSNGFGGGAGFDDEQPF